MLTTSGCGCGECGAPHKGEESGARHRGMLVVVEVLQQRHSPFWECTGVAVGSGDFHEFFL